MLIASELEEINGLGQKVFTKKSWRQETLVRKSARTYVREKERDHILRLDLIVASVLLLYVHVSTNNKWTMFM